MRDIRFRAWDKHKKIMIHHVICGTYKSSPDLEPHFLMEWADHNKKTKEGYGGDISVRYEIMQYVGLKDRNGVEIYEGDIITTCTFNYLYKDGTVDRKASIEHNLQMGVVEWIQYNCSFMVMRRQFKERLTDQWNNSFEMRPNDERYEVEVIGNIYENPELLTTKEQQQ